MLEKYFKEKEISESILLEIEKYIEKKEFNKEILKNFALNQLQGVVSEGKDKYNFTTEVETVFIAMSPGLIEENSIEIGLLLRNKMLFSNLKTYVILVTEGNEENFQKVKTEMKREKILCEKIDITFDDYNDTYLKVKDYFETMKLDPSKVAFDTTTGFKNLSLTFYKIAAEEGIESFAWSQPQEKGKRVPGTIKLDKFNEPLVENNKIKSLINNSIKKFDFTTTAGLYSFLNKSEYVEFYKYMQSILPFNLVLSNKMDDLVDNYIAGIENYGKKYSSIHLSEFTIKMNKLNSLTIDFKEAILKSLFFLWMSEFYYYTSTDIETFQEKLNELNGFRSNEKNKEQILIDFIEDVFSKFEEENQNEIDEYEINYEVFNIFSEEIYKKYLSIRNLLEIEENLLKFENGKLNLVKYNIVLDFNDKIHNKASRIGRTRDNSSMPAYLVNLILSKKCITYREFNLDYTQERERKVKDLPKFESPEQERNYHSKCRNDIKKFIEDFNQEFKALIKNKYPDKKVPTLDFIQFKKINEHNIKYYINEECIY